MYWFVLRLLGAELLADGIWWWWADFRLRKLPRSGVYRIGVAAFALFQIAAFVTIILSRFRGFQVHLWAALLTAVYLWHLLVLPLWVLAMVLSLAIRGTFLLYRFIRSRIKKQKPRGVTSQPASAAVTRRQAMAAAAVAASPLLTGGVVAAAMMELNHFRVRKTTVNLPMLPFALDGLTIAHVSDVHVGRFTTDALLESVVKTTNDLKADLVLLSGDLIDYSLSDLPKALSMVQRMEGRFGTFMCQGNHDLFADRYEFGRQVRQAGIPLLVNDGASLEINGQAVQILGLQWSVPGTRVEVVPLENWLVSNMNQMLRVRDRRAFSILLSHHPHALDYAEQVGIPLTLAGHTHGGQLMLTEHIGVGPMMFKYVSGLYTKPSGSALVVSNGVGNWFPLRINAPAEIVHITLRPA